SLIVMSLQKRYSTQPSSQGCRKRPGHGHRQDRNGFHTRSHTTAYPMSYVLPGAPWQVLPPTGRRYHDAAREWDYRYSQRLSGSCPLLALGWGGHTWTRRLGTPRQQHG